MKHLGDTPAEVTPPVAIGGVGGSGTRIVAQLLRATGVNLGSDVNAASDTLWFTLLFKRIEILASDDEEFERLVRALVAGLRGGQPLEPVIESLVRKVAQDNRPQHPAAWLQERCQSLLAAAALPNRQAPWGWKEPNTHVVIDRLWQYLPDLRYIHVVRHGLDMAFSSNQNQLRLWGPHVLHADASPTAVRSLAYWCHVHRRMQGLLDGNPQRMYWLDYDALCREPDIEAARLCRFLDCDIDLMRPILEEVRKPGEARHTTEPLKGFDPADLDYVQSLGYPILSSA